MNIQHNCLDSKCSTIAAQPRKQERVTSETRTLPILQHTESPLYLLNTHSIHNYQQIHDALPDDLRKITLVHPESARSQIQAHAVEVMKARKDAAIQIPSAATSAAATTKRVGRRVPQPAASRARAKAPQPELHTFSVNNGLPVETRSTDRLPNSLGLDIGGQHGKRTCLS